MRFAIPEVEIERRADGSTLLRASRPLGAYDRAVGDWLVRWAERTPDQPLLAERDDDGWRKLSYRDALARVRGIGESLLSRGLGASSPLLVLSANSIDHALVTLGAMHAGIPVAPVSTAYSLVSQDHTALRAIVALIAPGLVFAEEPRRFAKALEAIGRDATTLDDLRERPGPRVDAAFGALGPDTTAKILFTSGSTGAPKAVINTQRMLCSSQASWAQLWPFLEDAPPIVCDWLPWSHTVGGNAIFNLVLRNGGTFYIDSGRPTPDRFETTLRNLRDVAPTLYFNVPGGFERLVPALESDADLRGRFFSRLTAMYSTGAALPRHAWDALRRLCDTSGRQVWMLAGWGSTEMTLATRVHYATADPANVGTPGPGVEIKLAAVGERNEARVRGPQVTPGYYGQPELTAAAFDAEGFYRSGDAMRLADPGDPAKGLTFDGRVSEDFKLSSGTWVHVGAVRLRLITAGQPLIQDAVITGEGRDALGALVFLDRAAVTALGWDDADVRRALRGALGQLLAQSPGRSWAPERLLVLDEPPSLDAGELTDKGYLNQRTLLSRRAAAVAALYAGDPAVITAPAC